VNGLTFEVPHVHDFLRDRRRRTKGVYFHAIGGTETHIHLAVNIEPWPGPCALPTQRNPTTRNSMQAPRIIAVIIADH
jgi:hypothetical protein